MARLPLYLDSFWGPMFVRVFPHNLDWIFGIVGKDDCPRLGFALAQINISINDVLRPILSNEIFSCCVLGNTTIMA